MAKTISSSPEKRSSKKVKRHGVKEPLGVEEQIQEWEGARCPICMDHSHNAVILCCSSYDYGCHPFLCNTSPRHSNCLDKFFAYKKSSSISVPPSFARSSDWEITCDTTNIASRPRISCPLCRGRITGWIVLRSARKYMNSRARNCSSADCGFTGTYKKLRKHAREVHPAVRKSNARDCSDVVTDLNVLEAFLELCSWAGMSFELEEWVPVLTDYASSYGERDLRGLWPCNLTRSEDWEEHPAVRRFLDAVDRAVVPGREQQRMGNDAVSRFLLDAVSLMAEIQRGRDVDHDHAEEEDEPTGGEDDPF